MSLSKNGFDVSQFYFLNRWFRQYKIFEMNLSKEYIGNAFVEGIKNKKPEYCYSGFGGTSSPEASGEPGHYGFLLDKISFKIEGSAIILLLKFYFSFF